MFAYCEVNVTLSRRVPLFGSHEAEIAVDVLNAFNNKNFSGFDEGVNNRVDPATGRPFDVLNPADAANATSLLTLPRRIQFRLGYRF